MSDMFEIVPKHPECKNCKNMDLKLDEYKLFGDGRRYYNYIVSCEHQEVCAEWMRKQNVHGD